MMTKASTMRKNPVSSHLKLKTDRLELFAGSANILDAEINDLAELTRQLDATVPEDWPPDLSDAAAVFLFKDRLEQGPEQVGWWCWYFVHVEKDGEDRTLIGNGGFKGRPTPDGTVEIGYSLLPLYRNRGYATEAVTRLVAWAFEHPEVRRVFAETAADNAASRRVLEKAGFVEVGEGAEEGMVRFEAAR